MVSNPPALTPATRNNSSENGVRRRVFTPRDGLKHGPSHRSQSLVPIHGRFLGILAEWIVGAVANDPKPKKVKIN